MEKKKIEYNRDNLFSLLFNALIELKEFRFMEKGIELSQWLEDTVYGTIDLKNDANTYFLSKLDFFSLKAQKRTFNNERERFQYLRLKKPLYTRAQFAIGEKISKLPSFTLFVNLMAFFALLKKSPSN